MTSSTVVFRMEVFLGNKLGCGGDYLGLEGDRSVAGHEEVASRGWDQ